MSRDVPPLALKSDDPWQRLEIDPALRRLAEDAAATAGLSVEEWLERAIRRACPNAFAGAAAAIPPMSAEPSPGSKSPIVVQRAPTIAERLAQQRLDQAAKGSPPSPVPVVRNDCADVAHPLAEPAAKTTFSPAPSADEAVLDALLANSKAAATKAEQPPPSRTSNKHLAVIAVAIALAITSGAVTAQYLIAGQPHAPTAPSNRVAAATLSDPQQLPSVTGRIDTASMASSVALPAAPSAPLNATPNTPSDASASASLASLSAAPAPAAPSVNAPAAPSGEASASKNEAAPPAAPAPTESASAAIASAATPPRPGKDDVAPSDPKALAPWLEQRATNGDAIAQYRLGVLYALGQGVRQDYQHAAQLFKTSAEAGVAEAQYNIGVMYGNGIGIDRDVVEAARWYRKAAAQGNANAEFNLGAAYSTGIGVQQSMDQAAQWFRRAASAGVVNAQYNLGLLYERGDGVPVSQLEAYAWYSAAAARGDAGAAQRRDRLAALLAPATLKDAQARAEQVAATIRSGAPASGALAPGAGKARAPKP